MAQLPGAVDVIGNATQGSHTLTLLDVVAAVADSTRNDREAVAAIAHLLNSGKVRRRGAFRHARLEPREPVTSLQPHAGGGMFRSLLIPGEGRL